MATLLNKNMSFLELHNMYPDTMALIFSTNNIDLLLDDKNKSIGVYCVGSEHECILAIGPMSQEKGIILHCIVPTSPTEFGIPYFNDFM